MKPVTFLVLAALAASLPLSALADSGNDITPESVLRLMNEYRQAAGLLPLRVDERLALAANDRMRHMEDEAYWGHESPDGVSPFVWLRVRNYAHAAAGENLAAGFDTAALLVSSWMESTGHRANILSHEYDDCGIAVIDGGTTGRRSGRSVVVLFARAQ